ncbi:(2Fe-2S)-binding protein [Streptomyces acidiscabies]|uniref:(2Fe-2S)-binding protein n=2 Tax=Streptomyces acidiscabies TaxID=42234 RepID=A0AAP6B985_9ACTN|nr:(2Fe-2S)-binding protein [Streptomyces acidiscabies]MBP5936079.1 (2Fe-2S)-binding protein [Streptomyces sp. LBUM 1476]MBZ3915991.1 (2Fe-2S)-binding protein [Streptomyces acidiscabies]MDX2960383.1 (2Fe-2S)-binding protein [Streptomyces acidiscabies]MDX3023807.1 (2Fe-2S)-binding protein [Streptomyces acidiscabies]MDX3793946.1 (2Fe-2S)-binding protein [Streptomyces acidiscabies]
MPTPPPVVHDAYARLTEVCPSVTVRHIGDGEPAPTDPGWVSAAGLAEGNAELERYLARDDAQVLRDYGKKGRPDVIASFGLHRYSWPACLLFTIPWFLHRRVPRFPVTHVSYDRTDGMRLAVRTPQSFACLPGDPAAAHPGARVVPDEEALRAELRAAVAEHHEPLLDGFGPRMRRRGRALWATVTDEIVEGVWYVAALLGEEEKERARRELELLLPGATRPYVGTAAFRELTGPDGQSLPTRDRASCCMYYTIDPDDLCATCPRTCDAERIAKLTATAAS